RAEGGAPAAVAAPRPSLRGGVLPADPRVVDGRLSEPAWASAPDSIANFTMLEPREGGVPTCPTVVKVLADPAGIVIGVRCSDPDPRKIVAFSKAPRAGAGGGGDPVIAPRPILGR